MIRKINENLEYKVHGGAVSKLPGSSDIYSIDHPYSGFSTGLYSSDHYSEVPSFNPGLTSINSTGTLIFNNETQGGSLSSIMLANRGASNLVIGFNSSTISAASGFILASGESVSYDNVNITEIWAIAPSAPIGAIDVQGLYHPRWLK